MSTLMYTCNSCMIQFKSSDLQRYHMKTEWHRYNLKRRIADLPPIDADIFTQKMQVSEREKRLHQVDEFGFPVLKPIGHPASGRRSTNGGILRGRRDGQGKKKTLFRSDSPALSIASQMSKISVRSTDYDEHSASEYAFTDESQVESEDYTDREDTQDDNRERPDVVDCVYCGVHSNTVEKNLDHMSLAHGLYVPERRYLEDAAGLVNFLIEEIVLSKRCMCCNFHGSSLESIRAHLASKSHCRIPYESKEERAAVAAYYNFNKDQEDDNSDTSEAESESGSDSHVANTEQEDINSNYTIAHVDDSGVELTLPTGARLGHRSMQRFYRQNLALPPPEGDGRRTLAVVDRRFAGGISATEYERSTKHGQMLASRAHSKNIKRQAKRDNFQKHYRDELLQ
ncbi:AaceriAER050Cp [[Ashbya] aceris (nom. inval.)]|nr:AaceriAER050Cp [[Ashbya] aceris (nom. inval.)]